MSMIGRYLRVSPEQLATAIADPTAALDEVYAVVDAEEEAEPPTREARHYSTYKAWGALEFLFDRYGFPVNVVHGEIAFAPGEDWGYGEPHYLPVERVREAAAELGELTYDALVRGVDPAELKRADVYPGHWDPDDGEDDPLAWPRSWYDDLVVYFGAAAESGDAMLLWLD
ncbi:YfbM family protein [Yinghuangia soli]|uniref:YfbM family protein n=1 Tax=Yinghuangia soli TaxID=2908204 RepID=A0AA41PTS5_9ACTN|nr:YfbM family protein [Yinghuangia soli]MCF2525730.1 YfbM family protein [Yinghuangia soli]